MVVDTLAPEIIVLDDVADVRQLLTEFLGEAGFAATAVATSRELLERLADRRFAVACVDLLLARDQSCVQTLAAFQWLFPHLDFPDEAVRADWGLRLMDETTGGYLLPMIKAISPGTEVVMVTSNWQETNEGVLRKWGSYVTVQKGAPDSAFRNRNRVFGLDNELVGFIRRIVENN